LKSSTSAAARATPRDGATTTSDAAARNRRRDADVDVDVDVDVDANAAGAGATGDTMVRRRLTTSLAHSAMFEDWTWRDGASSGTRAREALIGVACFSVCVVCALAARLVGLRGARRRGARAYEKKRHRG